MNLSVFQFSERYMVALLSFEKHLDYTQVAEELYIGYRQKLGGVDAIVVRPPVERPISDLNGERSNCRPLLERFPYLPIFLLYSNHFQLQISDNLHQPPGTGPFPFQQETWLESCRQREMEDFVLFSPSIYRSPVPSVYRTPSQEYTTAFLRVGNIQNRRHVLDVIFFWLLPELKEAGALLTDSWSISSISFNIGRLYSRYAHYLWGTMTLGDNFHVNFLSSFYHGKRAMGHETRQALMPLLYSNNKKILFLMSAVKTKKSLEILERELAKEGYWEKIRLVALYVLQPGLEVNRLCTLDSPDFLRSAALPDGFQSWPEPPPGKAVVVIDERTFIPSDPRVKQLPLSKDLPPATAGFFERYLGMGALTVHRDAYFDNLTFQRHHGLFVDVGVLLQHSEFQEKLRQKIRRLSQAPAAVIFPPHQQGKAFVERIAVELQQHFGQSPATYCFAQLERIASPVQTQIKTQLLALDEGALILVVDDVLTTGNRLKGYQKTLRELPYQGRIHYLVGVARPPDVEHLNFLRRDLQFRPVKPQHGLDYIEEVFLPDWNDITCPWCRESKALEDVIQEGTFAGTPTQRLFSRRQVLLSNKKENGLTNDAFFSINGIKKAGFAGGSIFCKPSNITEAELITRIAAAVHHFKTVGRVTADGTDKLGVEFPLYTIVRSDDYLGDTFNEALIKAAILRSCEAAELYAVEDRHLQEQRKLLGMLMGEGKLKPPERCFFLYELFLTLRTYKLPEPIIPTDWKAIFQDLMTIQTVRQPFGRWRALYRSFLALISGDN